MAKKETKTATDKVAVSKKESTHFVTKEGKKYAFTKDTPATLRVLDQTFTQEELLENKDAMEWLIYGKSCFIKPLK
jgi:hypothetical protein